MAERMSRSWCQPGNEAWRGSRTLSHRILWSIPGMAPVSRATRELAILNVENGVMRRRLRSASWRASRPARPSTTPMVPAAAPPRPDGPGGARGVGDLDGGDRVRAAAAPLRVGARLAPGAAVHHHDGPGVAPN